MLLLLLGLVITCVMSWHITGGNDMLQHLDTLQSQQATLFKAIDDEVKAIIQDAADFAQASPEPDPSELWTDVLLEG